MISAQSAGSVPSRQTAESLDLPGFAGVGGSAGGQKARYYWLLEADKALQLCRHLGSSISNSIEASQAGCSALVQGQKTGWCIQSGASNTNSPLHNFSRLSASAADGGRHAAGKSDYWRVVQSAILTLILSNQKL